MITERIQFSKARLQMALVLVGVPVLLITVFLYVYAFRGISVNPDTIFINTSDVKDGKLVLSGSTVFSTTGYSGYSFQVKDGKLFLRIRYVPVVNYWHPSGDFRIVLSEKDITAIRQVYLYGKGSIERLVWARKE